MRFSRTTAVAKSISRDGVVITPSHNPPDDGGFKYNPPNGGPAESDVTKWIQDRANVLLRENNAGVKRCLSSPPSRRATTRQEDFVLPYVNDLRHVIDMDAIRGAGLKLGVDPLGGASVSYWEPIADIYSLNLTVVNPKVDPTFSFHDRRPRWQDSHGLFESLCDGGSREAQGPIPRRFWQ